MQSPSSQRSYIASYILQPVLLAFVICGSAVPIGLADDSDGFTFIDEKRAKAEPTPREAKVFSFGRFEPLLRDICREMEGDGRRSKLVKLSEVGRKGHPECASCRALWKSVYWACRDAAILDAKATPKQPSKEAQSEPLQGAAKDALAGEGQSTPTPTLRAAQRYPTPTMLDLTSRLSASLYNQDPGTGGYYKAVQSFVATLRGDPSLTAGERDYYDVFSTFLLASWSEREVPLAQATQSSGSNKRDLAEMFE